MDDLTRRDFVKQAAVTLAAAKVVGGAAQVAADATTTSPAADSDPSTATRTPVSKWSDAPGELRWLEEKPAHFAGTTWGVPWPIGKHPRTQTFALNSANADPIAIQTWPLATWPDGSLKWSAHAIPGDAKLSESFQLSPGKPATPARPLKIEQSDDSIDIDTGVIRCQIPRSGPHLIESIDRAGRTIASKLRLICRRQDRSHADKGILRHERFTSDIAAATLEQSGDVRAVIRLDGKHKQDDGLRAWLPFTVRLYFYAGAETVRLMHTFIFDGDPETDFIAGLGVRFDVPMSGELYDRHVRFAGESDGLWAEGVRNLTGLRRNPGAQVIEAQLAGKPCPPIDQFAPAVARGLPFIPAWGDYTLLQSSADAFEIRKRTQGGCCWITAAHGHRAPGAAYIGSARTGGIAFSLRDFWQRHPTQLDLRGATGEVCEATMWLWSPDAPPMDLRFYHDVMGMQTHAQQLEGLDITYEDYEPGFATATGVARSSEMLLWAADTTPSRQAIVDFAQAAQTPPLLSVSPAAIHAAGVFGHWSLPDRSSAQRKKLEDLHDWFFDYYHNQREQRRWYGFWDYGDVRHTYDRDRHVWRYDIGGYAWDNSELSPDLWLYYAYLRSGRSDIFRFAEAMTRHTSEVDVYHLGRFAGLGTRHGVVHWGDSAKQLRISTANYRRFYYYLTADERTGNLLRAEVDADRTFALLDPLRKIRTEPFIPKPHALSVGFGTDWGSLASAWFTEFERTGDEKIRQKLLNSMRSIGAMPHGFFSSGATYDPDTGLFTPHGDGIEVSHLSAVFGLPEICAELIDAFPEESQFANAWIQYCTLYNAGPEAQRKVLGRALHGISLVSAHSRLTAYAAWKTQDAELAKRAWREFTADDRRWAPRRYSMTTTRIDGPAVLHPIDEADWVSTNDTAQWCLSALENLALVPQAL